jgi:hypothetical protein
LQKKNFYNNGANRAYYAVFQKISSYLDSNNFDYISFNKKTGKKTNNTSRKYYHDTILRALIEHTYSKYGTDNSLINDNKNLFGYLQSMRIKADYSENNIENKEIDNCCHYSCTFMNIIDKIIVMKEG